MKTQRMKNINTMIPSKRKQLQSQERKLATELENDAADLESKLESTLKNLAIIGAGALSAVILYKLIATEPAQKELKKKHKKTTHSKPSAVTASVVSLALQKLIPLAIEKFVNSKSKSYQDEKVAPSTSK